MRYQCRQISNKITRRVDLNLARSILLVHLAMKNLSILQSNATNSDSYDISTELGTLLVKQKSLTKATLFLRKSDISSY